MPCNLRGGPSDPAFFLIHLSTVTIGKFRCSFLKFAEFGDKLIFSRDGAYTTLGRNLVALSQFFHRFRGEDVLDLVWSRKYPLFRLTFNPSSLCANFLLYNENSLF